MACVASSSDRCPPCIHPWDPQPATQWLCSDWSSFATDRPDEGNAMKITKIQTSILRIPEDDPLADMPEEAGRLRPIVILRMQTDSGLEGIGLTFYGGAMTATLRSAVDELGALIVGDDPLRIEAIVKKLRLAGG